MKIDIKKVAKLANLTVTQDEEKEFEEQLGNIVGYIEKLDAIDTSNIEPTAQVTGLTNRTRSDQFSDDCLSQEDALSGTETKHNNMFKVEKLVDTTA